MPRVTYVNGRYLLHSRAKVHVEDRGYQFADGVYEVMASQDGVLVDAEAHLDRLGRSLDALKISWPMPRTTLAIILREVVRRNRLWRGGGMVYVQITRGVAPRDHAFPASSTRPSLVVTARRAKPIDPGIGMHGVDVITMPDIRWGRCDIKSVALLPNVLGKQTAREAGAYEAWLVDRAGHVTEGTSTNAWIVDDAGNLATRHADNAILRGVTRLTVSDIAKSAGMKVVERPFTVAEAKAAREAFLTSTTGGVVPVVRIDGQPVGDGVPGPIALRLRDAYFKSMTMDGKDAGQQQGKAP